METFDKIKIFDALPTTGAKIEPLGNQSIKIINPCGCYAVHHFFAGKPDFEREKNPEKYDRIYADRFYFVELCNLHQKD